MHGAGATHVWSGHAARDLQLDLSRERAQSHQTSDDGLAHPLPAEDPGDDEHSEDVPGHRHCQGGARARPGDRPPRAEHQRTGDVLSLHAFARDLQRAAENSRTLGALQKPEERKRRADCSAEEEEQVRLSEQERDELAELFA